MGALGRMTLLSIAFAIGVCAPGSQMVAGALGLEPASTGTEVGHVVAAPTRAEDARLRARVLGLIQNAGYQNSDWGVMAVSLERGDTLLSLDPDRPLAPASNQKLFTTAAALHYLGPEYRFPTFLLTDGEIRDGVLEGNLILYGTGDPAISDKVLGSASAVWEAFASTLKDAGVHTVSGDLVADASYFQGPGHGPSWSASYLDNSYAAPVSALSFAENVVTFHIRGGPPGSPARVRLVPEGARLPVINNSVSVPGDSRRSLFLGRQDLRGVIEIEGRIGSDSREVSRRLTVADPPSYAATVLLNSLSQAGIVVRGSVVTAHSTEESVVSRTRVLAPAFRRSSVSNLRTLSVHYSPPLRDLIQILNKESNNLYAETLLLTVGRVVVGEGSFKGGTEALSTYLREIVGLNEGDYRVEDGSGLSRANRTTASGVIRLLRHVSETEHADVFWGSLPEAGNPRELRRMYQSAAAGNLRAKTGTIRRVSALSGMVHTSEGEPVLFSIISNNVPSSSRAKRIEDGIGIELASFSRSRAVRAAD